MSAVALELLDTGGPAAVTTRAVAERAGSSIAAVDELFGGKPGLVQTLHMEGFARLADELAALPPTADPERGVVDVALTMRAFAASHPHLYDVMFSRPFAELRPAADDGRAAESVYRSVLSRVAAVLGPDRPRGSAKDAAIGLVAATRGLVDLERAGILGSSRASIERRWRSTVLAVLRGSIGGIP